MSDDLVEARRKWVAARKQEGVEGVFRAQAIALPLPPSFHDAVRVARADRAVVAEYRRQRADGQQLTQLAVHDFVSQAEAAGACAIAIWPDEELHGGSYHDILAAAQASPLPVLSLDPVVDPVQVVMARAHGAAAVTIDVAHVSDDELRALFRHAIDLGLDAVVVASTALNLERVTSLRLGAAETSGARLIGIHGANADGSADVALYEKLAPGVPEFAACIATVAPAPADAASLEPAGYDAFLTGDAPLLADDFAAAMRDLAGDPL